MADEPLIVVVVVGFGSSSLLAQEHFVRLTAVDRVRLVVVDGWSGETERSMMTALAHDRGWTLVGLEDNPGFGAAVNRGVDRACHLHSPEVVVVVNPDAVVTPHGLDVLARAALDGPARLVCPIVEDPQGAVWFGGGEVLLEEGRVRTRGVDVSMAAEPWVTGTCLSFTPTLWDRLGGFDERYFMYWEDVDLSWRARRMGASVHVEDRVRVTHLVGATQGHSTGKSDLYRRYNARNRLRFAATHLRGRDLRRWIARTPRYVWTILVRGGRRQVAARPLGTIWSVVRGTAEGLVLTARRPRAWGREDRL